MSPTKTVFIDVNTQRDFLDADGALYIAGADEIIANLAALFEYARDQSIPVISSVDVHAPDDPEFVGSTPHCVKDTPGCEKIDCTLLATALNVADGEDVADLRLLLIERGQIVIEKPVLDMFHAPPATTLIAQLDSDCFVVFGVATDFGIRDAVEGLLARGGNVVLVIDAIRAVDPAKGSQLIADWTTRGVKTVTTHQITGG